MTLCAPAAARTVSSSVAAGLPIQEKPIVLKAPLIISPSSPAARSAAGSASDLDPLTGRR